MRRSLLIGIVGALAMRAKRKRKRNAISAITAAQTFPSPPVYSLGARGTAHGRAPGADDFNLGRGRLSDRALAAE